jgi:hypothetical protein
MDKRAASRVLGIDPSASRTEARAAYLRLLTEAASEQTTRPDWYQQRAAELQAAYDSFGEDTILSDGSGASTVDSAKGKGGISTSGKVFLAILGLLILAGIVGAITSAVNPAPRKPTPPASSPQPVEESSTPAVDTAPDAGQSGLVGTCWRDVPGAQPDAQGMVNVEEVDCSSSSAEWYAYKEATTSSGCSEDYLETTNGYYVCLRKP